MLLQTGYRPGQPLGSALAVLGHAGCGGGRDDGKDDESLHAFLLPRCTEGLTVWEYLGTEVVAMHCLVGPLGDLSNFHLSTLDLQ